MVKLSLVSGVMAALSVAALTACMPSSPIVMNEGAGAFASAAVGAKSGSTLQATSTFSLQQDGSVRVRMYVTGATPGNHAVHIHVTGDCSAVDGSSAGAPWMIGSNLIGILDNVVIAQDGTGTFDYTSSQWTSGAGGTTDIRGRSLVIHTGDLTSPGPIVGCGSIFGGADPVRQAGGSLFPASGSSATGGVTFTYVGGQTSVHIDVAGLPPGNHALHIHQFADCSAADGTSAGGHWNPTLGTAGLFSGALFDLGQIAIGQDGTGSLDLATDQWTVGGSCVTDVQGHAVEIHAGDMTSPGVRVACAPIQELGATFQRATATLASASGSKVTGSAVFTGGGGPVSLQVSVAGATPGMHAFHIHAVGDCSAADASSAGGHWDPTQALVANPTATTYLGNPGAMLYVTSAGTAAGTGSVTVTLPEWSLTNRVTGVIGHAVVIHEVNAATRVACGVIQSAP